MSEVKYRHPANRDLEWAGKGRQPKWVEAYLANGGSLVSLEVAVQEADLERLENDLDATEAEESSRSVGNEIDLGIGEVMTTGLTASTNTGTAVSQSDQPLVRFDDLAVRVGVLTKNTDELFVIAADSLNTAAVAFVRAGVAFLRIQENFGQSERSDSGNSERFIDWIEQQGIPKQRVYESIAAARFVMRLPPAEVERAVSMGKSRLMLLASLSQEVIDQAAESGNDLIGKADMMTVAELKEEIKALQRREKNFEAELERTNSQVKRLSEAKKRTTDFLLRTEELREECMALQFGAELHLNSLKRLFEETDPQAPEGMLQLEQLWVVANTLAARSLDLLEFMRARVPDGMPERPMTQHMLTPDEAIRWLQDYPLIENRFAAEAAVRESRREAARPRGPGRPSGSKNKGAEE